MYGHLSLNVHVSPPVEFRETDEAPFVHESIGSNACLMHGFQSPERFSPGLVLNANLFHGETYRLFILNLTLRVSKAQF